ncbi:MAG: hypothetical protein H8D45_10540 [Bacteroidetes bacterium]|nr:hypothetical protein [Bacteroidota bacterium]MBL7104548.1 hypothetical protein [Bacteroidales bacterium]
MLLVIIIISPSILAQPTDLNSKTIDKKTYRLYLQKNWDSLIIISKQALKENIDYFYLRMRIGIAFYEIDNYRKAAYQFEKAIKFNTNDQSTLEYLYYCYLNTNRDLEANELSEHFSESLQQKIKPDPNRIINNIYFGTGPTFSNNISKNKRRNLMGRDSIYGEQDLNDNKYYLQLGLRQYIGKRFSVYLGYTNLTISKLKQIQAPEIVKTGYDTILYNGSYYVDTLYKRNSNMYNQNYKLYQNQVYINANIALGKGFTLIPAFHWINVRYNTIYANIKMKYAQSYDTIPSIPVYSIKQKDTSFNNYVASLALYKNISVFNLGLFGSYSNLNNKNQYQLGTLFTWFPKGNLDFYTTSTLVSAWGEQKNRFVFEQLAGVKVSPKIWTEGFITIGEMINYNEKNGFIVHNLGDKIKFRAGTNLIITLSHKIELSLRYQFFNEECYLIRYNGENSYKTIGSDYQNNTITGGLKWKL